MATHTSMEYLPKSARLTSKPFHFLSRLCSQYSPPALEKPPKKEEIGRCLATARNILDTLNSLSWLCPKKWLAAYEDTVAAFFHLVAALDDIRVTPDELTDVCNSFRIAYAAWRAE